MTIIIFCPFVVGNSTYPINSCKVMEREPDREDDPFLGEKLMAEAEGIFLWCLEGLHRLIENGYKFTISKRAEDNLAKAMQDTMDLILLVCGSASSFISSSSIRSFHSRSALAKRSIPDAPEPTQWLSFVGQLLEPEDIITLQEFMGYVLLPTTKGQQGNPHRKAHH